MTLFIALILVYVHSLPWWVSALAIVLWFGHLMAIDWERG